MMIDTISSEVAETVRQFRSKDCQFHASKKILSEAKIQINRGNFEEAVELLRKSRKSAVQEEQLTEELRILEKSLKDIGRPRTDLALIRDRIRAGDISSAQEALKQIALASGSDMENELRALRAGGVVAEVPADHVAELFAHEKYREALIESEIIRSKMSGLKGIHARASELKKNIASPELLALYDSGRYEEFIRDGGHAINLMESAREALTEAEMFGSVPDEIATLLKSSAISDLECGARRLNDFLKIARPNLTVQLERARLNADEWTRTHLMIANIGDAHAFETYVTLSEDFETRRITPVTVQARETVTLEFGIRPRTKGDIPFEISLHYTDRNGKRYDQQEEFWIEVIGASPGMDSTPPLHAGREAGISELFSRYQSWTYIGKGGFARVYRAKKKDGTDVAVKVPTTLNESTGKAFLNEIQNWTSLDHENIVKVYDYNIMPIPYFEMELCDSSLADVDRPVACDGAAWILFNVCEGLKCAHAQSVLHRDLKPQNILLINGMPKVADWGLSKVMTESQTTTISGGFTAYYAAPEQITNRPKDQRTDIWQLGVILYELVTGRLPFTGESMVEIGMAIATEAPGRPGAVHPDAEPLDAIILRCLEKSPEQRYQSVTDLQGDLAAYLKLNYAESLKESIQGNDLHRSAYYCGDLVLISMKIGDLTAAYKYAVDLVRYSQGETRAQAAELVAQVQARAEMGAQELPIELIRKAEVIVHQTRVGETPCSAASGNAGFTEIEKSASEDVPKSREKRTTMFDDDLEPLFE
ncbi:MAG: serine/threonine-protein kinase [Methanoculleus sp.]|jgi:tRNA A-37 threonylcarbamoyl transferase component Bud32